MASPLFSLDPTPGRDVRLTTAEVGLIAEAVARSGMDADPRTLGLARKLADAVVNAEVEDAAAAVAACN